MFHIYNIYSFLVAFLRHQFLYTIGSKARIFLKKSRFIARLNICHILLKEIKKSSQPLSVFLITSKGSCRVKQRNEI